MNQECLQSLVFAGHVPNATLESINQAISNSRCVIATIVTRYDDLLSLDTTRKSRCVSSKRHYFKMHHVSGFLALLALGSGVGILALVIEKLYPGIRYNFTLNVHGRHGRLLFP